MIRGIPLQSESSTNFDYRRLPPETLRDALRLIDPEITDSEILDQPPSTHAATGEVAVDARAVTREVRRTMEEVLGLLSEALAAHGR
jgi:hypothetical protein